MKKLIFILLLIINNVTFAQVNDEVYGKGSQDKQGIKDLIFPNPFEFKYLDTAIIGSQDELYVKARAWVAKAFVSSKAVIQMDDKAAGKIIGKANMETHGGLSISGYLVEYMFTIDVRANRCRLLISTFYQNGCVTKKLCPIGGSLDDEKPDCSSFNLPMSFWKKIKLQAQEEAELLILNFQKSMQQPSTIDKDGF